jgi:N-acetylglucosamine transport system permease protein
MRHRGRTAFIVCYLAPAALFYGAFVVWPLLDSFIVSLYRWKGLSQNRTYVGLENYRRLLEDDVFWRALKNNLWLLLFGMAAIFVLGLLLAHALNGGGRIAKALRSVVLFPQVISLVAVAILWMFMYNPSYGLVTTMLKGAGAGEWAGKILGSSESALPAVGIAFLWYALGFYIMLFAVGLSGIPDDVLEAAELDGSHGFHRFRTVSWPMLWSVKRTAAIYVVINVMNVFALVWLMTQGGPDRATEVMLTYLYQQGFTNYQFGYATTLAVANFFIAMLLAAILMWVFRKNPEEARA